MPKILVIDGQGGRMGAALVEKLLARVPDVDLVAVGTNSTATAAMVKAGAKQAATGENPVLVNCRDASLVLGPLGIVVADSLLGEVTPAMALAVGQSTACKVLLPVNRCDNHVVGVQDLPLSVLVQQAVDKVCELLQAQPA